MQLARKASEYLVAELFCVVQFDITCHNNFDYDKQLTKLNVNKNS